jgi:hypothetical protein
MHYEGKFWRWHYFWDTLYKLIKKNHIEEKINQNFFSKINIENNEDKSCPGGVLIPGRMQRIEQKNMFTESSILHWTE